MNTQTTANYEGSKGFHIALLIVQILMGLAFCAIGLMKLMTPINELALTVMWAGEYPAWFVRGMGLVDFAGGLGMLLPTLTRIKPNLAYVAAGCAVLLQICAIIFHVSRGEANLIPMNFIFLFLAAFIYWGRSKKAIVSPR